MSFFTKRNLKKLQLAIIDADLITLKKQFNKLDSNTVNEHLFAFDDQQFNAVELAIRSGQAKSLQHLLQAGCGLNASHTEPLLYQALQHPVQSLQLMTVLLQAGAPLAYPDMTPDHALFACFLFCPDTTLMLHLSRLNENGADLNHCDQHGESTLRLAMQKEDKALVQMLINSGATFSKTLRTEGCGKEITDYAERLADDLKIRQMMLTS
ncbi:ankyrin repeat domain-containing protein [Amphritea japonica]|uniref:Ankyrin n=1 Tax=Amphritea japonica ATCC BAA-1530 TaxID=1278309 RepID=A0A7R6P7U9_9GAMM|nr:ankyrin repeat domain-containing protein [Amphritea japonica]BBB27519.1 hypothetical protein AMJAP_2933 [Amphritea japonica ATCC BAA-1530]